MTKLVTVNPMMLLGRDGSLCVEFSEVSNYYGSLSRLEIPIARRTAGSEEYENR